MENKAVEKRQERTSPSLFDSGWMERFFNSPIDEFFGNSRMMNVPAVNVAETEKDFVISLATPGMDKKDFKVEAFDNVLTISAEKENEHKEEKNGRYNRREYNYSSWSRSFTLPENCDASKIDANYNNGELKLLIPKNEIKEARKTKTITVN
jgi:HSP20 family protein